MSQILSCKVRCTLGSVKSTFYLQDLYQGTLLNKDQVVRQIGYTGINVRTYSICIDILVLRPGVNLCTGNSD